MQAKELNAHLRKKCEGWSKDHCFNPHHCTIDFHSAYVGDDGKVSISFDVFYKYSAIIRALLIPLYVIFTAVGKYNAVDWLEDVAYFKRVSNRGMQRKRDALKQTKDTFHGLFYSEAERYLKEHENG